MKDGMMIETSEKKISVNVKFFAVVRDVLGASETTFALPPDSSAASILDALARKNARFASWRNHVRIAVNSEYVDLNHVLHDGDEVAIIPPVSGG